MKSRAILLVCFATLLVASVSPVRIFSQEMPLFTLLSPEESGISFTNNVIETQTFYMQVFIYAYNGGGVAVGDVNGDGLPDFYFSGTQSHSPNRLYLNKGNLRFEDISATAGVDDSLGVRFGVSMIDIDADGDLDIYVCKQDFPNKLYINNGNLTFTDRAAEFGLDYCCSSTQGAFFDYDHDGDLDLYLGINGKARENAPMVHGLQDRFFRNDGNTFTDVTESTGIRDRAYSLSVSVGDFNEDGWSDVFVSNDFQEPDLLYINNGNGTFTNTMQKMMPHSSLSSMGSDAADFNNDGHTDIITLDMVPESHWRKMSSATSRSVYSPTFDSAQMLRNTLQLNRGDGYFSDIADLAGVAETDWSWGSLIADFDNDGRKDIFITNGFKRDMQNLDIMTYMESSPDPLALTLRIPPIKIPNYTFQNNGDLTFRNVSKEWGMDQIVNSNGAAFADLDRDGDLDLVVNNLDSVAFVLRNNSVEQGQGHYLQLELQGTKENKFAVGARVKIQHGENMQVQTVSPVRGYLSSVEPIIHFGIGKDVIVDELTITWPDGKEQILKNIAANQRLKVKHSDVRSSTRPNKATPAPAKSSPLFADAAKQGPRYHQEENQFEDFNRERLLPNRFSRNGPGMAVGDVNGDRMDDIWIGGAQGISGQLFLQMEDGSFLPSADTNFLQNDAHFEDLGGLFFDAEGDGDLDLYVVSGGNECDAGDSLLGDRLYLNSGSGAFERAPDALPELFSSGSCVIAADFDQDGDLDLFVGGRVVPGLYPDNPRSALLRNDAGRFTDVTADIAPMLSKPGMVTSALWTDYDNDGDPDLFLVGEWMTPRIYQNDGGYFVDITPGSGLEGYEGWWNSVVGADFDNDGDIDYVVGNLGMNTKPELQASQEHPLRLYSNDFDGNGSRDIIMSYYYQGNEYPTRNRNDIAGQMGTYIRRKFPTSVSYATATIQQILSQEKRDSAAQFHASTLWHAYVENLGNGRFRVSQLPPLAQLSPVFGMIADDFNGDSNPDILLVGNFYGPDGTVIRYDAGYGLLLAGNGKGEFAPVDFKVSGFEVSGDARSLSTIYLKTSGILHVIAGCNSGPAMNYEVRPTGSSFIRINPLERYTHAELIYGDGGRQRYEFHYGSGYLSQQSLYLTLTPNVSEITLYRGLEPVHTIVP